MKSSSPPVPSAAQQRVLQGFAAHFGAAPALVARAPGRVNLIGEHTDYNEGLCLPCAIDRDTWVAAAPRSDGRVQVVALDVPDHQPRSDDFALSAPIPPAQASDWRNYVRGVVAALQARGAALGGVSLAISGDVPQGAGLSSSASLELALGTALKGLFDLPFGPRELALAGQQAEHQYAGCQCGLMDQLASACGQAGQALLLDCRDLSLRSCSVPADTALLVVESGIERGLVQSEYNLRRQQCEAAARHFGLSSLRELTPAQLDGASLDPLLRRRARHVVRENQRTLDAFEALQAGDLRKLGRLLREAHASLRDDFEVSLPAIDQLVALANEAVGEQGGARLTGGGFGGCVLVVLPRARLDAVEAALRAGYRTPAGTPPRMHRCVAAAGARLVEGAA